MFRENDQQENAARPGQQTSGSSLIASFSAQLRRFLRLMRPPQPIPAHGA